MSLPPGSGLRHNGALCPRAVRMYERVHRCELSDATGPVLVRLLRGTFDRLCARCVHMRGQMGWVFLRNGHIDSKSVQQRVVWGSWALHQRLLRLHRRLHRTSLCPAT